MEEEEEEEEGAITDPFSAASRPTRNGTSNCCTRQIVGPLSSTGECRSGNVIPILANHINGISEISS